MGNEVYVQLATDGSGKKVGMDLTTDVYGNAVYLQKALLVGEPAENLAQILDTERQILTVLRALLRVMTDTSNSRVTEEDFSSTLGAKFDA